MNGKPEQIVRLAHEFFGQYGGGEVERIRFVRPQAVPIETVKSQDRAAHENDREPKPVVPSGREPPMRRAIGRASLARRGGL